jgi:hypothetical protein
MKQGLNNSSIHAQSHVDLINEEIELFEQSEKPLSKGDKLAILMDCSDRLHKRWIAAWDAYNALPEYALDRLTKANSHVTRKIVLMLGA